MLGLVLPQLVATKTAGENGPQMASSGIFLAFPSAYLSISAENERLTPRPIYLSLEIPSASEVPALSPGKKTQSCGTRLATVNLACVVFQRCCVKFASFAASDHRKQLKQCPGYSNKRDKHARPAPRGRDARGNRRGQRSSRGTLPRWAG